jgi:hypothetical protein
MTSSKQPCTNAHSEPRKFSTYTRVFYIFNSVFSIVVPSVSKFPDRPFPSTAKCNAHLLIRCLWARVSDLTHYVQLFNQICVNILRNYVKQYAGR